MAVQPAGNSPESDLEFTAPPVAGQGAAAYFSCSRDR